MLIVLYTILYLVIGSQTKSNNIIVNSIIFGLTVYIVNQIYYKSFESFVECNEGNHLLEPNESEDYIDPSIIESKLSNIGHQVTRYPFDKRYIPSRTKKWCLKSVIN
jgi:hypothetical protein